MKLPVKLDVSSLKYLDYENDPILIEWLKELSESYNSTINYIEQLEERIRDLEKNELY